MYVHQTTPSAPSRPRLQAGYPRSQVSRLSERVRLSGESRGPLFREAASSGAALPLQNSTMSGAWEFWIDRGGTFTDVLGRDPTGEIRTAKLLSTSTAYEDAAVEAMRRLLEVPVGAPFPTARVYAIKMGTTVATNALLERKGAKTLFVTTEGFADAILIGDQARSDLFALNIVRPSPVYAGTLQVSERLAADGSVVTPLAEDFEEAFEEALEQGFESCAIALLHADLNPTHEARVAEIARRCGFPFVATSHEVSPLPRFLPRAETTVVDAVTLTIAPRTVTVIVGTSGSGKTTLLRMINRLVEPTSGTIRLDGEDHRSLAPHELRRRIGYAIQGHGLFPHRTITENIGAVPQLLGWKKERIRERSAELLELIGLDPELGDRYPAQLSGGQQQRVGVARALAADPLVMLMDEPFGAIDPINRERLQNEFLRLQAEIRKTVLFVTHDIDEAIKMGDRIAVMREGGRVEQYATPAELLMAPANEFVEDFVGADRALKRLALMRVADINLWEAPLAHVGQATTEVRAKLAAPDVEVPYALLVDGERRPLGWLTERDLAADVVPRQAGSPPGPVLEREDVMRDALADLLQGESQYAPVVDHRGRVAGVLSVEIISEFLGSPEARSDEHSAVERPHE